MKTPKVIEFLRTNSFFALREKHNVDFRPSQVSPKFTLNYNSITADPSDEIANSCRGLVIRPLGPERTFSMHNVVGDCEVVAWPLDRFFNAGDPAGAQINWTDERLRVYEKLDGTCCILYWDNYINDWCVGTRSTPDADVKIYDSSLTENVSDYTFSELFWRAVNEVTGSISRFKSMLHKGTTYVFELTTPKNRVVVNYETYEVTLLAARRADGDEIFYIENIAADLGVKTPKQFKLQSKTLDDVIDVVNGVRGNECEGCVVVDSSFNRLKVKSKEWVQLSSLKSSSFSSKRGVMKAIVDGIVDDLIPLLTVEQRAIVTKMRQSYCDYLDELKREFDAINGRHLTQKDFAALAMKSSLPAAMFRMRNSTNDDVSIETVVASLCKSDKALDGLIKTLLE